MFKRKVRILFLDSDNVCTTQIAVGVAMLIGDDRLLVKSAGINAGRMPSSVITAMQKAGIENFRQKPTSVSSELVNWSDTVISLSEYAKNKCPTLPTGTQHSHWRLSEPILSGSQLEIEMAIDQLTQQIRYRIDGLLGGLTMMSRSSSE